MRILLLLFTFSAYVGYAQTDTLLKHSLEEVINKENNVNFQNNTIRLSINKDDAAKTKMIDGAVITINGKELKIIVLDYKSARKDFYLLPMDIYSDYYVRFRIQGCDIYSGETYIVSFVKIDGIFILDSFSEEPMLIQGVLNVN